MVVVYVTDQKFEAQCGISLLSLLHNNPDLTFDVYFMDAGISEEGKAKLAEVCKDIHYVDIRVLRDHEMFQDVSGYNPVIYARLMMANYLPDTVDRVLYLDADTVVDGSIKELATLDISNMDVAAVPETYMPSATKARSIGFSKQDLYYNSGMLLINLKVWREQHLGEQFVRYIREHQGQLLYPDQDILNACCKGRIRTLPTMYNMSPNLPYFPYYFVRRHFIWYRSVMVELSTNMEQDRPERHRYQQMLQHPVIIHYMGDERPWIAGNYNYYRDIWRRYQEMSPWNPYTEETGKERYLFGYHMLNLITSVMPWFRILFSSQIGINIYAWRKKWTQLFSR